MNKVTTLDAMTAAAATHLEFVGDDTTWHYNPWGGRWDDDRRPEGRVTVRVRLGGNPAPYADRRDTIEFRVADVTDGVVEFVGDAAAAKEAAEALTAGYRRKRGSSWETAFSTFMESLTATVEGGVAVARAVIVTPNCE